MQEKIKVQCSKREIKKFIKENLLIPQEPEELVINGYADLMTAVNSRFYIEPEYWDGFWISFRKEDPTDVRILNHNRLMCALMYGLEAARKFRIRKLSDKSAMLEPGFVSSCRAAASEMYDAYADDITDWSDLNITEIVCFIISCDSEEACVFIRAELLKVRNKIQLLCS